jgi:hypothetical protein
LQITFRIITMAANENAAFFLEIKKC